MSRKSATAPIKLERRERTALTGRLRRAEKGEGEDDERDWIERSGKTVMEF